MHRAFKQHLHRHYIYLFDKGFPISFDSYLYVLYVGNKNIKNGQNNYRENTLYNFNLTKTNHQLFILYFVFTMGANSRLSAEMRIAQNERPILWWYSNIFGQTIDVLLIKLKDGIR